MDAQTNVEARTGELAKIMAKQLRLKTGELPDVVARAGRLLPGHIRRDADVLLQALSQTQHPKLASRIDLNRFTRSERRVEKWLLKQDPGAARRGQILDVVAGIAFVFVVIVLSVFFFMLWQGKL